MYRWKSTIPSCRFSHCYCWWNFKISHRKQPRPLADTHVNFERPAQVSISGDCIAITWRHLIFFCVFLQHQLRVGSMEPFTQMTTMQCSRSWLLLQLPNRNQQTENCLWNHMQWVSEPVTHRLTLPEVGDPRIIAQHWQLDLWNWEHISQTHRIHVDCGACHWVLQKFSAAEWHPGLQYDSLADFLCNARPPLVRDLLSI